MPPRYDFFTTLRYRSAEFWRIRFASGDRYGSLKMKFSRAPIIIQTECRIAVLLNLDQSEPRADGMNRACR